MRAKRKLPCNFECDVKTVREIVSAVIDIYFETTDECIGPHIGPTATTRRGSTANFTPPNNFRVVQTVRSAKGG